MSYFDICKNHAKKWEEAMKRLFALLGLALLVGCQNTGSSDCPRKDKSCGKSLTQMETTAVVQNEAEVQNVTPSK